VKSLWKAWISCPSRFTSLPPLRWRLHRQQFPQPCPKVPPTSRTSSCLNASPEWIPCRGVRAPGNGPHAHTVGTRPQRPLPGMVKGVGLKCPPTPAQPLLPSTSPRFTT